MDRRVFLGKSLACSAITFSGARTGVAAESKKEPGLHITQPVNKSRLVFPKNQARKMITVNGTIDIGEDLWKPALVTFKITLKNNNRFVVTAYAMKPEMKDGKFQFSVDQEAFIKKGRYVLIATMLGQVPYGEEGAGKSLESKPVQIEFEIVEK